MSAGFGDKVKGDVKEAGGKTQEELGEATGDADLQARGEANQLEGKGDQLKGNVKNVGEDIKRGVEDL